MLDTNKQILRSHYESHMRSLLQSLIYVEDSKKLLKGRLAKLQTRAVGVHSPPTFQEKLLGSAAYCGLASNWVGVYRIFYQKAELSGYKYIFQKLSTESYFLFQRY